jgi:hypothetical protein
MVEMPTRIVMMNGDKFGVDMEVDKAAKDILVGADRHVLVEPVGGLRAYLNRDHIAYVQASSEPMVSAG